MKVITDGRGEWTKIVKCSGCESTLEINGTDIEYWVHHDYGGGSDPVTSVQCPICNETIHLSNVPTGFVDIARKKYEATKR
jgi:ribosomal protein S27E